MINRYNSRKIFKNEEEIYEDLFRQRNVKNISHYNISYDYKPSTEEYATVNTVKHIWKIGDRYYKLALEYYGDSRDWWLIAKFNNKPTESDNNLGDVIYIPTRVEEVKRLFRL